MNHCEIVGSEVLRAVLPGCNAQSGSSSAVFQRNVLLPPSGLTRSEDVGSCLAYSLTLKMEAVCSSEMLMNISETTQHYPLKRVMFVVKIVVSIHVCFC
jgi:hypothetical protein